MFKSSKPQNPFLAPLRELGESAYFSTFLVLSEQYREALAEFKIEVDPPSMNVQEAFLKLPHDRQRLILEDLFSTVMVLEELEQTEMLRPGTDLMKLTLSQEVAILRAWLNRRGLSPVDPTFFHMLDEGDVIEVYDHRAIQIARSWTYFRYCSYSLADLLVYDWSTLYVRPKWVLNTLMQLAPQLFRPGCSTVPYDIPEYLLVERFRNKKRGMLFKMKYASPLIDTETGQTVAFLSTGALSLVPDLELGANLDLL